MCKSGNVLSGFTAFTATATPAKAKKMAALIENWTPPDGWCNENDRDWHEKMKGYICDFLRKCNGFRVM
ncbi:hypothetical protein [Escherichia coli]|uniref:DUF7739 domain-containing protein n=1 Tax=Escherichia coli TaxID=562 RepID=UPI003860175E